MLSHERDDIHGGGGVVVAVDVNYMVGGLLVDE